MKSETRGAAKGIVLAFLILYTCVTLGPLAMFHILRQQPDAPTTPGEVLIPSPLPSPAATSTTPGFLAGQALPGSTPTPSVPAESASFTLKDQATGETFTVGEREFLMSAIACEMDLHSPEEALKAQAVAAYTFYSRQREQGQAIACDRESWLVYAPESAMRERWGEDFDSYWGLLGNVVDAVRGQTLTYGGKLALTSYFAISPGSTEAVENVWAADAGEEHPYLQAVASPGDAFSDGYLSTAAFSEDELKAAAEKYLSDAPPDLSGPAEGWLTGLEYTPSGMIKTALLGGRAVTGTQLRAMLGLRSASFTVGFQDGTFTFTVRGWGHGVGMSQAGAVFMAKRGANYREILAHYYPGTELAG